MLLNLGNPTKFRLNEINKTENYFIAEIQERETMSNRLSKCNTIFIGMAVGIASASFSLVCPLTTSLTIETIVSQALIHLEISHEKYTAIINKEEKYRNLKEDDRLVESRRNDVENDKLIEEGKKNENK